MITSTPEHEAFRKVVRDLVENEINPYVDEWEEAGIDIPLSRSTSSGRCRTTGGTGRSPWTSVCPVQLAPAWATSSSLA